MLQLRKMCGIAGGIAAVTLSVLLTSTASAGLSDVFFRIEASNGTSSAAWEVRTDDPSVNYDPDTDTWSWSGGGISLMSGDDTLAVLNNGSLTIQEDPVIVIFFDVQAGGSDTVFSISSAVLSFPALINPTATASMGLTVTDSDADADALLTGGIGTGGNNAFTDVYNAGASTFLEGISSIQVTNIAGSNSDSANSGGFQPVAGAVVDMQTHLGFTLSANDSASGTGVYVMIPEPSAFALVFLGSVLVLRRRP